MKIFKTYLSPRWHLRKWLGINDLERASREACLVLARNNSVLIKEINDIRTTGFLGFDLGYHEQSQIVLLHYNCAKNAWKVIADTKYNKGSYQSLIRELRHLCEYHNVKFMAEDAPVGAPDLTVRMGIKTDYGHGTEKETRDQVRPYSEIEHLFNKEK
jgi:hypothetical protein